VRKHTEARFHSFYRRIENEGLCVYCGQRASTVDHFVPLSVQHALRASSINRCCGWSLLFPSGICERDLKTALFQAACRGEIATARRIGYKERLVEALEADVAEIIGRRLLKRWPYEFKRNQFVDLFVRLEIHRTSSETKRSEDRSA
jgi:hypothetical protein